MKNIMYLLSTLIIVSFFGISSAQGINARGNGMNNGQNVPGMMQGQQAGMNMYARLNLTNDQLTKINELRTKFMNETLSLRTSIQSKGMELQTLMAEPEKNQSKILAIMKEKSALHLQLQEKRLQMRINIRKILTPEQLALLPVGGMKKGGYHKAGHHKGGKGNYMGGRGF